MKRLLYLQHVPWNSIKQRPHFLVEQLSRFYQIDLFHEIQFTDLQPIINAVPTNLSVRRLFVLPFRNARFMWSVNSALIRCQLRKVISQYDYVWFTCPNLFGRVAGIIPPGVRIIYDCMDDAIEFPRRKRSPRLRQMIINNERKLIERADTVLVSSGQLKDVLMTRYGSTKEIHIVNNATSLPQYTSQDSISMASDLTQQAEGQNAHYCIMYLGTISEWLDMDLLLQSLPVFPDISYQLVGPCEIVLPVHDRVVYRKPVPHDKILNAMREADALVMPFKVNDLVRSVDPVKLYEYVLSGKPSIAVEYGETLKFRDYIYLYRNKQEYFSLVGRLIAGALPPKKSPEEQREFVLQNTWAQRVEQIVGLIQQGHGI